MGGKARLHPRALAFFLLLAIAFTTQAQTADQAWLRYPLDHGQIESTSRVHALGSDTLELSAASELQRGINGLPSAAYLGLGNVTTQIDLGTGKQVHEAYPKIDVPRDLGPEGYWLHRAYFQNQFHLIVAGGDDRGVLYGAFVLLRLILTAQDLTHLDSRSSPAFKIRWVDEWDNPDGSIERGYAGRSIFFEGGNVRADLAPVSEYARLLASVGINGLNVNNVNAAPQLIDTDHLKQIAHIADALRPWGVRLAMSVAIANPQIIGGLSTYDPLDPQVKAWWAAKANEIYALIPDFAGFTVKADSEGQPGPASFGRTPADAANTLAAALAPHGGVVLYRAFVYNHHLDWRDPKADRARAAYDIFHPLDGKFLPNVIVQIKEGPIDFQAREPVSPLFAGLQHTSQAMELQITQEYTGQQRHLVYLAPMWKGVLDTDLRANNQPTPVKEILAGKSLRETQTQPAATASAPAGAPKSSVTENGSAVDGNTQRGQQEVSGHDFSRAASRTKLDGALAPAEMPLGGIVGVAGIGRDRWLASPLALANLYAFGRLAWNPNLDPAEIAAEWTKQTISIDPEVVATVQKMLMQSWPAYESYTGPLGLQTLTDITGSHYGPNIESSERNGWGQWHDADAQGVGKDRSVATGSGYAGQYPPQLAKIYEDPATTPDDLLLFFHHVPYTYKLHDGKTVIQEIYDRHYDGAAQAAHFVDEWATLKPRIDPALYEDVRARLEYQAGHAIVWRDAVVQYFLRLSGIPDAQGRAGHYPGRLEAEDARLTGYKVIDVTPWEDASGGKAVTCQGTVIPSANKPTAEGGGGFNPREGLNGEVGRGFIPGTKRLESLRALSVAEKLNRAVGRGFIPGTKPPESTGALAPEACFSCISEKSSGFSAASLAPAAFGFRNRATFAPFSTSSSTPESIEACSAEWTFNGAPGRYNIAIQYFDLQGGAARFTFSVNNQPAATWQADATLPSNHPNGDNSTRRTIPSIALNRGDALRIEGTPDGPDPAAFDYIELTPVHPADSASQNP